MIGIQIIQRLRDLHSIGIIHNDIKPNNILINKENGELLYLIDFGLSK